MKTASLQRRPARLPLAPAGGLPLYLLLTAAAAVFTQALRSSLSAVIFAFVLALPVADLLLLLVTYLGLAVRIPKEDRTVVRGEPLTLTLRLINRTPFPIPCLTAEMSVPDARSVSSRSTVRRLSLPPLAEADTDVTVGIACRGVFSVGVEAVYFYDMLRLIRVRKRIGRMASVRVLPRRLTPLPCLPAFRQTVAERPAPFSTQSGPDGSDLRAYRPGDSIKSIHWKLSTKVDELQVRQADAEPEKTLLVVADFTCAPSVWHFDPALPLAAGNGVAEEALTAVCEAARQGIVGQLILSDPRRGAVRHPFTEEKSAESLAFPLSEAEGAALPPPPRPEDREASLLLIAPFLSPDDGDRLAQGLLARKEAPVALLLLSLEALLPANEIPDYRRALTALCRRLTDRGIAVTVSRREEGAL